jgi:hypothetical protein
MTKTEKIKAIILDNNPLSLACYAEDHPEEWKKMCGERK